MWSSVQLVALQLVLQTAVCHKLEILFPRKIALIFPPGGLETGSMSVCLHRQRYLHFVHRAIVEKWISRDAASSSVYAHSQSVNLAVLCFTVPITHETDCWIPVVISVTKSHACSAFVSEGQKTAQQAFTEVSTLLLQCAEWCLTTQRESAEDFS